MAAAAEAAPGNDSPCIHGRSVPVADLSNGSAQYCIVLYRVAVVTGEEGIDMPKKSLCTKLKSHSISDLSVCAADCRAVPRLGDGEMCSQDVPVVNEAVSFHVFS